MRLYRNNSQVAISQNDGTNDEQIIFNTTTAATTYYVQVYGYNGAFNNNSCYNLLAEISGTNFRQGKEEEEPSHFELVEDEFLVFPNPTSGDVTMMIPFGKHATGTLQIYDIAGKLMFSQSMEGDRTVKTFNMDVSSFQAGMYLINFTSGEKQYKQKLAIVRQ
ncbi:MAG: T9SS type A sorting domain-containing protein [Saprospiraceae bacterium]|nr:T9SS type A sorting domain-containing protein [Saprospiraceae bacterium]